MRNLGITIDFAPVVDVTTESDDEVIGDRSFGSDPAQVTDFAGAYAQGLRDAGLLPVLKHFPGHGHASGDSHEGGVVTPPLADLQANDLVPYRTLTTQAPVAVMVGHMQVPGLTGSDPASLSPDAYGLLRSGNYGGPPFDGLVFTDDLSSMGAINRALRRRRCGAARPAGRGRRRAVGHHRRGARGAGPAGEGGGVGRTVAVPGGRFGAAAGRVEGPESAVRRAERLSYCLLWSK